MRYWHARMSLINDKQLIVNRSKFLPIFSSELIELAFILYLAHKQLPYHPFPLKPTCLLSWWQDITQTIDGMVMVTGQLFYHPEDAKKKGGGNWQIRDTRELFYSTRHIEVPAKCVMHKCVVHFIPANKQLPDCREHPGFIVRQIYDAVEQKLWKITDKDHN